jgi:hypothetical protein
VCLSTVAVCLSAVAVCSSCLGMLESGNDPFHGGTDEGHLLDLHRETTLSSVTSNANGSSGWARVLRSGGGDVSEGACRRVHQCARNPCIARRAASLYGPMGPPIHVQPIDPAAVSFGPSPPSSAPLRAGQAPSPASLDPQLRMGAVSGIRETNAAASGRNFRSYHEAGKRNSNAQNVCGLQFLCFDGSCEEIPTCHVGGCR